MPRADLAMKVYDLNRTARACLASPGERRRGDGCAGDFTFDQPARDSLVPAKDALVLDGRAQHPARPLRPER